MVCGMQQWNDFIAWINSDAGWRIVSTAILPFVAIVLSGLIAALIGRNAVKRVIDYQVRGIQAAAVTALIEAGRSSSKWSSLMSGQQSHAESEFIAADIRLRLLPLTGAAAAADWATHEVADMRKNSASFTFQAEQSFIEFRNRLLEWQRHPNRARKLFAPDLERFRYEDAQADAELVEQQRLWAMGEAAAAAEPAATTSSFAQQPAPVASYSAPLPVAEPVDVPEPIAAPEHVNAAPTSDVDVELPAAPAEVETIPFSDAAPITDVETSSEPVIVTEPTPTFSDEDRNEDDPGAQSTDDAATQALPLSYFDPVPQRPAFPVRHDED